MAESSRDFYYHSLFFTLGAILTGCVLVIPFQLQIGYLLGGGGIVGTAFVIVRLREIKRSPVHSRETLEPLGHSSQPNLGPPLGFGINRGPKSIFVEPPKPMPFEAILGLYPLALGAFKAPKDRLGVKIKNQGRPVVIHDLWLRYSNGEEQRRVVMGQQLPVKIQPNVDSEPLHFFPWNPWIPDTPVTICVQIDGQAGEVYEFPTALPPLPR